MKHLSLIASIVMIALSITCLIVIEINKPEPLPDTDYIFNVIDDSIVVYHNDLSYVGTVKLEGQLDCLITDDNQ